jgi:hypothetical protein
MWVESACCETADLAVNHKSLFSRGLFGVFCPVRRTFAFSYTDVNVSQIECQHRFANVSLAARSERIWAGQKGYVL